MKRESTKNVNGGTAKKIASTSHSQYKSVSVVTVTIATIDNKYFKAVLFSFFIMQMYK